MPRQSRIDYPGALHHIMVRGIERKNIFSTDPDKEDFLKRLSAHVEEHKVICFAFSLMSNHVHLLLQTGTASVSKVMQSIQTGYAMSYNLRHKRTGKLYQNRFKSVLCDKEEYLLQLVRYIHLNPVKAGIIETMAELDGYPWTSHSVYMGKRNREWHDTEEVLSRFGRTEQQACREYRKYIRAGLDTEDATDYDGGGMIRSLGGYWETRKQQKEKNRKREAADERILGGGKFVEEILAYADEQEKHHSRLTREGWDYEKIEKRASDVAGIDREELYRKGRGNARAKGRAYLCKWLVVDKGETCSAVGEKLGISGVAVSRLCRKGEQLEAEEGIRLIE